MGQVKDSWATWTAASQECCNKEKQRPVSRGSAARLQLGEGAQENHQVLGIVCNGGQPTLPEWGEIRAFIWIHRQPGWQFYIFVKHGKAGLCRCVDERAQNKYLCKRATSYMERPREKISALGNCGPATPPILRAQFQCSSSVKYNIFQLRTLSPSATLLHELRRHVATITLLPTRLLLAPSHHMTKVAYLVPGQDMFSVHPLIGISDELSSITLTSQCLELVHK